MDSSAFRRFAALRPASASLPLSSSATPSPRCASRYETTASAIASTACGSQTSARVRAATTPSASSCGTRRFSQPLPQLQA
ncbi:MAG: hypothetical protein LBL86_07320 [Coriobacteriales bacterium]|nr:hypothetical protein [Coriobacteriales bacterium]